MNKIRICNAIGLAFKAGKVVLGEDNINKFIKKNKISLIIVGKDTGKNTLKSIKDKCENNNINLLHDVLSIYEISNSIGKYNRVVLGIIDKGFTDLIIKARGD